MPDVLSMGELLVEFVSTERNTSLAHSPGFLKAAGGAPANVAVALKRLGLHAGFAGKVGNDPFGEFLRETLQQIGVETTCLVVDPEARTTAVFVAVWEDGRKDLCFYRNPGADMQLSPSEVVPTMFAGVRGFHYGSISLIDEPAASAQRKALEIARDHGCMISYDPNYRPTLWPTEERAREVIQGAFAGCHLAKVSEEEWEVATGSSDVDAGIAAVLAHGVELLVVSRGERSSIATNGEYYIEVPSYDIHVVETTGAGDGFMAAMITKLLPERERFGSLRAVDQHTVEEALRYANAVGALTCTQPGAIPALPTDTEVQRFLAERSRRV